MISLTYATSGILLAIAACLFWSGRLTSFTQTAAWCAVFFFASAGASSAYLTVSEIFPMEIRAMAISFFFVVAQGAGVVAPWLFGKLIETSATGVFLGQLFGAALMVVGGLVALRFGVDAEGRSLEDIAPPLSVRGGDRTAPPR